MDELDALSREVAAASDAWMVPGVDVIDDSDGGWLRICQAEPDRLLGVWAGQLYEWTDLDGIRPNLRDPVTVNALLGATGNAWQDVCGVVVWMACVDNADVVSCVDRTEAIARAWIAAHGKEKANG
jgi:hypothetical protein